MQGKKKVVIRIIASWLQGTNYIKDVKAEYRYNIP